MRLPGFTLPGLANAHSHAFHRALRGAAQAGQGTFWTWRERMYQVAGRLQPDSYLALARAVYAEMALAGITCVGEFHYLHHDAGGARYRDPNQMGLALIEAAAQAGLRITLLDTCYLRGGLAADGSPIALSGVQERFGDGDGSRWAERAGELGADEHGMLGAHARAGVAIHSVRAVPPDQMQPVVAWSHAYGAPLHAHLSEQPAENEACLAAYGVTPARLLDRAGALGPRSTVVHATHLTGDDIGLLGGSRTVACFCPTTEADLADGIGPGPGAGRRGLPAEPGQRQPRGGRPAGRGAAGGDGGAAGERPGAGRSARRNWPPRRPWPGTPAWAGRRPGRSRPARCADLVTVALDTPRLAGIQAGTALESVIFAGSAADVRNVVISGRDVVAEGRHLLVDDVPAALDAAIAPLLSPA